MTKAMKNIEGRQGMDGKTSKIGLLEKWRVFFLSRGLKVEHAILLINLVLSLISANIRTNFDCSSNNINEITVFHLFWPLPFPYRPFAPNSKKHQAQPQPQRYPSPPSPTRLHIHLND